PVCVNPFGVTYNPLSVHKGLDALLHKEHYAPEDLDQNQYNNLWFSFDHYTGFSSPDREQALQHINTEFTKAQKKLQNAGTLLLTWGTAWVYRYKPTGEVVCNCHKIPASEFTRSRLTTEQVVETYRSLLPELFANNQHLKVILTVSPVRHWKDGAHGNQLSKSTLLLACDELATLFPEQVFYFPSYEILMDELRDYRFYGDDLIHPSQKATEYIWEKFAEVLIHEDSKQIITELNQLLKMMEHRPMNKQCEGYRKMIRQMEERLQVLKAKYPSLSWEKLHPPHPDG
ncbi:MAG: GSCFA domain-containing protein, partial [Bacteroidales bacterium]|nr:GSCFA domain-containing protein [Bacteroidales bacterium]